MDQDRKAAAGGGQEDFGLLFEQSMRSVRPGGVVRGRVVQVSRDAVTVDIGYKSEGQISVREFMDRDGNVGVQEGDEIDVYFDTAEGEQGGIVLSRAKAEQFKVWHDIEEAFEQNGTVEGTIVSWRDTKIEADFGSKRPNQVTVNSVFGSDTAAVQQLTGRKRRR